MIQYTIYDTQYVSYSYCDATTYNMTVLQEFASTDTASKDKLSVVINAHTRDISRIAVNHDGTKVATASTKVTTHAHTNTHTHTVTRAHAHTRTRTHTHTQHTHTVTHAHT